MTELLTAAQMRAVEQAAIESDEVTGLELMERAGRGVVEAIFEEWPELAMTSHRAVVLCGPGNNGGDGFVVARLLKEWGWEVEVFLYGDPEKLPPDARVNYERWGEIGVPQALTLEALLSSKANKKAGHFIVVDAIFGTGLSRPLDEALTEILESAGCTDRFAFAPRVSVDLPSGVCSDSGKMLRTREIAPPNQCLTVTFHSQKLGHVLVSDRHLFGNVKVVPLGIEDRPRPEGGGYLSPPPLGADRGASGADDPEVVQLIDEIDFRELDKDRSHKYFHGHALILSGGPGRTGAARLAARGALRIGAGLVTLGCPQNALNEVAGQTTAVMCRGLDGPPGLAELLEDARFSALCLGPGLGLGADAQRMVMAALEDGGGEPQPAHRRSVVLDADALTRFERSPEALFDALHERCVLTPHAGEFKRLFPDIAEKLEAPAMTGPAYSKVDATREAAARAGCVVLFKGPDTVIADPLGRCSINASVYERAAPWLATAGSGDVLAGYITGLLARGFEPMKAAETAAWLHTECALSFGPGLIAEDLPEELPKVLSRLLAEDGEK